MISFVSALLAASVERVGVSHMRDFLCSFYDPSMHAASPADKNIVLLLVNTQPLIIIIKQSYTIKLTYLMLNTHVQKNQNYLSSSSSLNLRLKNSSLSLRLISSSLSLRLNNLNFCNSGQVLGSIAPLFAVSNIRHKGFQQF